MAEWLTKMSIWMVIACYGIVIASFPSVSKGGKTLTSLHSAAWWLGVLAFAVHVLLAFGAFYEWRWTVAWQATADQAEQLSGVRAGWGLWMNFAFGAVWILLALRSGKAVHGWIDRLLHGFVLFMVLMGGIAFAPLPARIFTVAVLVCSIAFGLVNLLRQRSSSAASVSPS